MGKSIKFFFGAGNGSRTHLSGLGRPYNKFLQTAKNRMDRFFWRNFWRNFLLSKKHNLLMFFISFCYIYIINYAYSISNLILITFSLFYFSLNYKLSFLLLFSFVKGQFCPYHRTNLSYAHCWNNKKARFHPCFKMSIAIIRYLKQNTYLI